MSNKEIPDPQPDDLTIADILAQSTPEKPRRTRKRATAKNIGVYDADRDILDQYLFEVSQTPLLTPEQEMAIARLVQAGDPDAMQELIKRNLRFVISVAKKYQNRGLGLSDLIGEGNLGLLTAARKKFGEENALTLRVNRDTGAVVSYDAEGNELHLQDLGRIAKTVGKDILG